LVARGELASWGDARAADLVGNIPEQLRDRVRLADFPLCVVAPHYELSANLVGFVRGDSYWFVDERRQDDGKSSDVISSSASTFAPECRSCGLRAVCCGVGARRIAPGDVVPSVDTDASAIGVVMNWLRTRGHPIAPLLESNLEQVLAELRRRAHEPGRSDESQAADDDGIEKLCRILLGGELPIGVGAGVRVTALRAPQGQARVELDIADESGLELVVHVERIRPGARWYLATRELALSHQSTTADVNPERLDHALRSLATYLAARERAVTN
jgi:hypothetical protein